MARDVKSLRTSEGTSSSATIDRETSTGLASAASSREREGRSSPSSDSQVTSTNSDDLATTLLRSIGIEAQERVSWQTKTFRRTPDNPHLLEVAKLADDPRARLDWSAATTQATKNFRRQFDSQQPFRHYDCRVESSGKVLRAGVLLDPNINPDLVPNTNIETAHHHSKQHIIRLIEDQLEATTQLYMKVKNRPSIAIILSWDDLAEERKLHTVKALQFKGIQIREYHEAPDEIEVIFEDGLGKQARENAGGKRMEFSQWLATMGTRF